MKTLTIICALTMLLYAALIHAQNLPQRDGSPTKRASYLRPGLERYLDKFGNRALELEAFQNQPLFPFWLNSTYPFEELMGFSQSTFGRQSYMARWTHFNTDFH